MPVEMIWTYPWEGNPYDENINVDVAMNDAKLNMSESQSEIRLPLEQSRKTYQVM